MHLWLAHVNSPGAQGGYLQSLSSEPSLQSFSWSHVHDLKMHRPLAQRNSLGEQEWNAENYAQNNVYI